MTKPVIIAVDAMGGENSPEKILSGISEYLKINKDIYFRIFGFKPLLEKELAKRRGSSTFSG